MSNDPQVPIKCVYSPGYGDTIDIWVTEIIPSMFVSEPYLLLKTENEEYPATWLEWEQAEMKAGCYENF